MYSLGGRIVSAGTPYSPAESAVAEAHAKDARKDLTLIHI